MIIVIARQDQVLKVSQKTNHSQFYSSTLKETVMFFLMFVVRKSQKGGRALTIYLTKFHRKLHENEKIRPEGSRPKFYWVYPAVVDTANCLLVSDVAFCVHFLFYEQTLKELLYFTGSGGCWGKPSMILRSWVGSWRVRPAVPRASIYPGRRLSWIVLTIGWAASKYSSPTHR